MRSSQLFEAALRLFIAPQCADLGISSVDTRIEALLISNPAPYLSLAKKGDAA
jgi:hypothetical protein